jgi:hypothetical protein
MTGNTSTRSRGGNEVSPPVNPKMRITPTPENPRGYPPFDMRSICGFTNNQVIFYLTTGAIPLEDQPQFQEAMEHRKKALQATNWDGASDGGHRNDDIDVAEPPDSSDDSECPTPEPGRKGIKFSPSDITKLRYNSTVAQYENWLFDLKRAFSGDPAKFPTSSQKIILASMTLDDQLKTTLNSNARDSPIITQNWRKFEKWIRDVVLHGDTDRLKLSQEFTTARQKLNEDPNEFYLRFSNLGIQAGRTVTIDDYRTRLLAPLRNLLGQFEQPYNATRDIVIHAAKLWQTLNHDKVRQEIREEKEKKDKSFQSQNSRQPGHTSQRPNNPNNPKQRQDRDKNKTPKPKLSTEEQQHRKENNLCFNCGYPGHSSRDCTFKFNPNRVQPKGSDKPKNYPPQAFPKKRPRATAQPVRTGESEEQLTDDSDPEEEVSQKRQKN